MKRTVWMMAAVGIVLLGLAACGSAAPESPDENTLFAANGPALTVVEKQPDQYTTDPEDKTVPPEQSPDLLTMNSQEEEGFALFYPLLSETQFRCLMDEDGVDFIPNRLVSCEEGVVKPEPEIYRRLLGRYGLDPAQTLFIDDRPANIAAAAALGIRGQLFDHSAPAATCDLLRRRLLPEIVG